MNADQRLSAFIRGSFHPPKSGLKDVADTNDDASITAVSSPLIEEVCRRNCRVGNSEISRGGEVEEVSTKLQALILADSRVLQNAEINVIDSIRTQDVASCVADSLLRSDRAEQRTTTRSEYLFNTHRREIEIRVQVRPDRVANQR